MRQVRFAARARTDIQRIFLWIASDNLNAAERVVLLIDDSCRELADYAERYPIFADRPKGVLRRRPVGRYNIYYGVTSGFVDIARVLHSAQDQSEALKN